MEDTDINTVIRDLAKIAKDVAAGAVVLAAVNAIIIAILLVTGNIYSYIELTKRNQIIDDLEDEK